MKVADKSGDPSSCRSFATKLEFCVDQQYVGWIKGPKGKVIQDVAMRSSTRIDVDQNPGSSVAMVKIYGMEEGVHNAVELIAYELEKVSPEAANMIRSQSGME